MSTLTDRNVVWFGSLVGLLLWAGCRSEPSISMVPSRTIVKTAVRVRLDPRLKMLPFVEARVNEAPARLFIVDTGTSGLVLSRGFLRETRVTFLSTSATMDTPAGEQEVGPMCHVARLRIGSAEFRGVDGCTADLSNMDSALHCELGGVIGIGVLADCQTTLDYTAGELLLEPARAGKWPDTGAGGIVLPLMLSDTGLPFVPLSIRGATAWAMVDSGSDEGFCLSYGLVEQLGLASEVVRIPTVGYTFHGSSDHRTVRLRDSVFLGPREYLNPLVNVESGEPRIGHQILRRFLVTIDIKNKQIRFAHPPRT
jgi:hypothetical protein